MEAMRKRYKEVREGDRTIDYEAILTGSPTNRVHRRMIAHAKSVRHKLHHDKKFTDRALLWYNCRVKYSSINKYCDAQSKQGKDLDPKNIGKEIKHCDTAIGYQGRIMGNLDK
jgi:hypothetical protein